MEDLHDGERRVKRADRSPILPVPLSKDSSRTLRRINRVRTSTIVDLIRCLQEGCEAVIGTLTWREAASNAPTRVAFVDGRTPLVLDGDLGIPDVYRLNEAQLLFIYTDGSVLELRLATSRARVLRDGNGVAATRLQEVSELLPRRGVGLLRILAWTLGIATAVLLVAWGLAADAQQKVHKHWVGYTEPWAPTVGWLAFALGVLWLVVCAHPALRVSLLPKRVRKLPWPWSAIRWGEEDVRRLVTAVVASGIFFALGLLVAKH